MKVPPMFGSTGPGKSGPGRALLAGAGLILLTAAAAACSRRCPRFQRPAPRLRAPTRPRRVTTPSTNRHQGGSAVKNFDVCAALPVAATSQITGTTFTEAQPGDVRASFSAAITTARGPSSRSP